MSPNHMRPPDTYGWDEMYGSYEQDEHTARLRTKRQPPSPMHVDTADAQEHSASFAGKGPKGFVRTDDGILEHVCALLTAHPKVDATDLEVSVKDGHVMLNGSVSDLEQKSMAEGVARGIFGVRSVDSQIQITSVRPSSR